MLKDLQADKFRRVEKRRERNNKKRVIFSDQKRLHLNIMGEDNESEEDLEDLDEDQIMAILK